MPKVTRQTALTKTTEDKELQQLTEKEELFCQYYTGEGDCQIGNGRMACQLAGYETKKETVLSSIASENLRKPHILRRIRELLNTQALTDEKVDCELAFVIEQKADLPSKMSGIKEYNRLKNRIKDSLVQIGEIKVQWGE